MSTLIEKISSLTIGSVTSVSPNEIHGMLDRTAPQATAINTGIPSPFPRINGYVLIPNESGSLVGSITWIGIDTGSPNVKGFKGNDQTLVNLPEPIRKIVIAPLGTLVSRINTKDNCDEPYAYELQRGVSSFPCVGDSILLPNHRQLRGIVETQAEDSRVCIGSAPLAANAEVRIDPDKLFGRHLAVLGNTGSGKSCSVAGLIRWSLQAAKEECNAGKPNARIIILDPNGEYSNAFTNESSDGAFDATVLTLSSRDSSGKPLVAPHWAWTVEEWTSILRTGAGFQGPLLRMALQQVKNWGRCGQSVLGNDVVRFLSTWPQWIKWVIDSGPNQYHNFPACVNVTNTLVNCIDWLTTHYRREEAPEGLGDVQTIVECMQQAVDAARRPRQGGGYYYDPHNPSNLQRVADIITNVLGTFSSAIPKLEGSPDRPCSFKISDLESAIVVLSERLGSDSGWVRNMLLRLRRYEEDPDICSAIDSNMEHNLSEILNRVFGDMSTTDQNRLNQNSTPIDLSVPENPFIDEAAGGVVSQNDSNDLQSQEQLQTASMTDAVQQENSGKRSQIVILDLSFVPRDILHTVIAVLGRIVFEALQWYRRMNDGTLLPTIMVLEEAHTFIHGSSEAGDDQLNPSQMCRRTFERIAREGRKFGLGLVISSQRPSELSPTILSQCNTFLLHRIVNDQDQALIRRLVPDGYGGLLRELPVLPTKKGILLGLATALPVLVEMRELPMIHQPLSSNPDFWNVWTGSPRPVDWERTANEWQAYNSDNEEQIT